MKEEEEGGGIGKKRRRKKEKEGGRGRRRRRKKEEKEEEEEEKEVERRNEEEGRRKSEVKYVQEERRNPGPKQERFILQRSEPCDVITRGLSQPAVSVEGLQSDPVRDERLRFRNLKKAPTESPSRPATAHPLTAVLAGRRSRFSGSWPHPALCFSAYFTVCVPLFFPCPSLPSLPLLPQALGVDLLAVQCLLPEAINRWTRPPLSSGTFFLSNETRRWK